MYTRDKDTRHAAIRAVTEEKYSDVGELYCIRTFPQFSSSVLAGPPSDFATSKETETLRD